MDKRYIPRVEFLWAERRRCQNLEAQSPPKQYTALNEILWKAHEYVRRRTKTAKAANVTTTHRLNVLQSLTRLLVRPGFLQSGSGTVLLLPTASGSPVCSQIFFFFLGWLFIKNI